MALRLPRWPSERENIEDLIRGERAASVEERLRRACALSGTVRALARGRDPLVDETERIGNERYMAWIRHCRERR